MRRSAQVLFAFVVLVFAFLSFHTSVYAQTAPSPITSPATANSNTFLTPNTDTDVPVNHHSYTQVVLIDMISAVNCALTGSDPTDPSTPCLGVNPHTGKIGLLPTTQPQQFGQLPNQSQPQGLVGFMGQYISILYVPTVSSSQYMGYLADNFGIVKKTYAAAPGGTNCAASFGYGFCGLTPVFTLWTGMRDIAYMMLTVLFIVIGIGVMLRFKVDPRTVMTLQNQIPRVVIAIILITFSYAIAGFMVDLMWTTTYAGINFISSASPTSEICLTKNSQPQPIAQVIDQQLIDNPLSFVNTLFKGPNIANANNPNCATEGIDSGVLSLASNISQSFGDLVNQILNDLFNINAGCGFSLNPFADLACITKSAFGTALLWITEQIVKLVIIIAILISMFRLWFELIKCYVTFLIFVILGPIWIVFGLIPGRPLGFEKWLRIIFSNLAAFPVVAFLLVFARVLVDSGNHPGVLGAATTASSNPQVLAAATTAGSSVTVPFVVNTNISSEMSFAALAIMLIVATMPAQIKNSMKATGQGKYGSTVAAGLGFAAGAATSPGRKVWENLNRRNHMTGQAEGSLALAKQRMFEKTPIIGKKYVARRKAVDGHYKSTDDIKSEKEYFRLNPKNSYHDYADDQAKKRTQEQAGRPQSQPKPQASQPARRGLIDRFRGRGQAPETGTATPPPASTAAPAGTTRRWPDAGTGSTTTPAGGTTAGPIIPGSDTSRGTTPSSTGARPASPSSSAPTITPTTPNKGRGIVGRVANIFRGPENSTGSINQSSGPGIMAPPLPRAPKLSNEEKAMGTTPKRRRGRRWPSRTRNEELGDD